MPKIAKKIQEAARELEEGGDDLSPAAQALADFGKAVAALKAPLERGEKLAEWARWTEKIKLSREEVAVFAAYALGATMLDGVTERIQPGKDPKRARERVERMLKELSALLPSVEAVEAQALEELEIHYTTRAENLRALNETLEAEAEKLNIPRWKTDRIRRRILRLLQEPQ